MPENPTPRTAVDAAFDQLEFDLRQHALDNPPEFARVMGYLTKVADMRARFAAGQPVNPGRPKTIAEVAAQTGAG